MSWPAQMCDSGGRHGGSPRTVPASSQSLWTSRRLLVTPASRAGQEGPLRGDTRGGQAAGLDDGGSGWEPREQPGAGNAGAGSPRQPCRTWRWHRAQRRRCLTAGRGTVRALAPPEGSGGVGQANPELGRQPQATARQLATTGAASWQPERNETGAGPCGPATHGREQSCPAGWGSSPGSLQCEGGRSWPWCWPPWLPSALPASALEPFRAPGRRTPERPVAGSCLLSGDTGLRGEDTAPRSAGSMGPHAWPRAPGAL